MSVSIEIQLMIQRDIRKQMGWKKGRHNHITQNLSLNFKLPFHTLMVKKQEKHVNIYISLIKNLMNIYE